MSAPTCGHRNVTGVFTTTGRHLSNTCDDCGYTVDWTATGGALAPQVVVVCEDGSWCGHAEDRDHGDRLRAIFDQAPATCGPHRVEVWAKIDADEAMENDHRSAVSP